MMDFGDVIKGFKVEGGRKRYQRQGWNGKGMFIYLATHVDMIEPFIMMKTADDKYVPWLASQTDMLADDWQEEHNFARA